MTLPKDRLIVTKDKAPRLTIFGTPGIGKTTLTSTFPDSIFVFTEEPGIAGLPGFEVAKTYNEFIENLKYLYENKCFNYKHIIIDTITALDALVCKHVLDLSPPGKGGTKPMNLVQAYGGYGAGYAEAAELHRKTKKFINKFQELDIGVIYVGHVANAKEASPDAEDYNRYSIEISHHTFRGPYINDIDAVLFCRQKPYLEETETGRNIVAGSSKRCIITELDSAHVAKNRYKMPPVIEMDVSSIMKYIPFYNTKIEMKPTEEK